MYVDLFYYFTLWINTLCVLYGYIDNFLLISCDEFDNNKCLLESRLLNVSSNIPYFIG